MFRIMFESTIAYLRQIASVRCPTISIAVERGTPARSKRILANLGVLPARAGEVLPICEGPAACG
jgi:hypothetical protein